MTTTHSPETNLGVVTSWLPITTTFSAPADCSQAIYSQLGAASTALAIAFDPYYGTQIDTSLTCLPPEASAWWNGPPGTIASTVTSLGPIVCPEQYTTATTSSKNAQSTFVVCCPSDYTYQNSILGPATVGECNSKLASGQVFTYMSASDLNYNYFLTSTTILATVGASVFAVPMNGYNFNDVADVISSSATTTSSSATTTSSSSSSSSSSNTALANSGSTFSGPANTSSPSIAPVVGLSTGAKAGIGIGVSLGVLGLIGFLAAFLLLRRHKKKSQAGPNQAMVHTGLSGGPVYPATTVAEFYSPQPQYELGTDYSHSQKGAGRMVDSEQAYGDTRKYNPGMMREYYAQTQSHSPSTASTSPARAYNSSTTLAGHSFAGRPERLSQLHEMG